jgi:hypothetical protein
MWRIRGPWRPAGTMAVLILVPGVVGGKIKDDHIKIKFDTATRAKHRDKVH